MPLIDKQNFYEYIKELSVENTSYNLNNINKLAATGSYNNKMLSLIDNYKDSINILSNIDNVANDFYEQFQMYSESKDLNANDILLFKVGIAPDLDKVVSELLLNNYNLDNARFSHILDQSAPDFVSNLSVPFDIDKLNIKELYKVNSLSLIEWQRSLEYEPEYLIVRDYDERVRDLSDFNIVSTSSDYFSEFNKYNNMVESIENTSPKVIEFSDVRQVRDQQDLFLENNTEIYKITASGECFGNCYVKASSIDSAYDTAISVFSEERLNLEYSDDFKINNELTETCSIEDIPDGDMLFDEDGSPMEAIDAKMLINNNGRGGKSSISANIKQSIYSGKIEKVQNKEQEYSEKRLHEREISRDERFGDTDYNVDSPY